MGRHLFEHFGGDYFFGIVFDDLLEQLSRLFIGLLFCKCHSEHGADFRVFVGFEVLFGDRLGLCGDVYLQVKADECFGGVRVVFFDSENMFAGGSGLLNVGSCDGSDIQLGAGVLEECWDVVRICGEVMAKVFGGLWPLAVAICLQAREICDVSCGFALPAAQGCR